jgi:hypothetical protein
MIDLPFLVRKALGFRKGERKQLDIRVEGSTVSIAPSEKSGPYTVTASPRGLLQLPREAHQALSDGKKGRYRLALQSGKGGERAEQRVYLSSK